MCKLFESHKFFNLKLYIWAWKILSRKIQRRNILSFAGHTVYAMLEQNEQITNLEEKGGLTKEPNLCCDFGRQISVILMQQSTAGRGNGFTHTQNGEGSAQQRDCKEPDIR